MSPLSCRAISSGLAVALLAACGSLQSPIEAPGAMPESTDTMVHHVMPTSYYRKLYSFRARRGRSPSAGLLNVNGMLYGTTELGGTHRDGTVFSLTTNGKETVLHNFRGFPDDGANPTASLINVNGTLYGTTDYGGQHGYGTVFSITTAGAEKIVYNFGGGSDGAYPRARLLNVNGTLYGTTYNGGSAGCFHYGCGTVYSVTKTGAEKVLYSFGSASDGDGNGPDAGLINVNGMLYGTTDEGGNGYGTVFSVTTAGTESVLHRFGSHPLDGSYPTANLINVEGTLYGTTSYGGALYGGTVFSITTSGSENLLYSFGSGGYQDGNAPYAGLMNADGMLYGTTDTGGYGYGTVFSVTMTGVENVLYRFGGGFDGSYPIASLVNVGGTFYGTTVAGGTFLCYQHDGCGSVFALTP